MTTNSTIKDDSERDNVVSMQDYLDRKTNKARDSVKQVFKDSLDNDQVMRRYKVKQPTIEERQERIRESIQRINKLLQDIKETK